MTPRFMDPVSSGSLLFFVLIPQTYHQLGSSYFFTHIYFGYLFPSIIAVVLRRGVHLIKDLTE